MVEEAKKLAPTPQVKNDIDTPLEILASTIADIADAVRWVERSRVTRETLIILTHEVCKAQVSKTQVRAVFDAIQALETVYLKRKT